MKKKNKIPVVKWHKGWDTFETFALELEDFTRTGVIPTKAGQDLRWSLEQQKKRLDALDLDLEYQFTPRGLFGHGQPNSVTWTDGHYISSMAYRSCRFRRTVSRGGRRLMKQERNTLLYQTITNVHDHLAARQHTHTCPSCGAIGTLGSLMDGCDYCGTHFKMSDLYPKVTGYYYLNDYGGKPEEVESDIKKAMTPGVVICAAIFIAGFIAGGMPIIPAVLVGAVTGGIMGGIYGYLFWAARMLAKLFKDAFRAIGVLLHIGTSRKRFVSAMRQYSPEFSYDYFSDAVINLLKTILYSEDPENLPIYEGDKLPKSLSNIVDSVQFGSVALKQFQVVNGMCHIVADVYMDNLYLNGRRIKKKKDVFRLSLRRDLRKPVDLHFSIHHLRCKNCGSSFDALRHKHCPACGSVYGTEDLDWIITDLRKW